MLLLLVLCLIQYSDLLGKRLKLGLSLSDSFIHLIDERLGILRH